MAPPEPRFSVALLDTSVHDRTGFTCGVDSLDAYLKRQAGQDMKRRVATTYVLVPNADPSRIAGYFTLSAFALLLSEVPDDVVKRLPKYDRVPAALIGRLARDATYRGDGVGELLLVEALARAHTASERVAAHAVVVDAMDAHAASFYRRYGFQPLADDPRRLFLPMATVAALWRR